MRAPENYLKLLEVTYAAVKSADPGAVVIGGAVDGNERWTEQLVALGGMKYMDVLSIHPYMFHAGREGTPERLMAYLNRLGTRLAAANGGVVPPVFITETGWPTVDSRQGITRERAADYVARTLLAVRTIPFVKGLWWYELQDGGSNPRDIQQNFGLVDSQFVPKPAYHAMRAVAPVVAASTGADRLQTPGGEWLIRLRQRDDATVLALWVADGSPRRMQLTLSVPADAVAVLSGGASGYQAREQRSLQRGRNVLAMEIGPAPLLIELKGSTVNVEGLRRE
jgi:hypothetical protein